MGNEFYDATGIRKTVVKEIIELAKVYEVEKVVLFGSRARGDFHSRSDIDLAFSGGKASAFVLDVNEETSTLLKFDIVDLLKPVQPELLQAIEREGIVLYEKI